MLCLMAWRVEPTVHLDSSPAVEATGIAGAATLFAEGGATQGRFRCGPAVVPVRWACRCGPAESTVATIVTWRATIAFSAWKHRHRAGVRRATLLRRSDVGSALGRELEPTSRFECSTSGRRPRRGGGHELDRPPTGARSSRSSASSSGQCSVSGFGRERCVPATRRVGPRRSITMLERVPRPRTSASVGGPSGGGGNSARSAGWLAAITKAAKSPGVQIASIRAGPSDSTRYVCGTPLGRTPRRQPRRGPARCSRRRSYLALGDDPPLRRPFGGREARHAPVER